MDGAPKDLSRAHRKHTGASADLVGRPFYLVDQLSDMNDRCFLVGDQVAASVDREISCADHVQNPADRYRAYDDQVPVSVDRRFLPVDHVRRSVAHVFD